MRLTDEATLNVVEMVLGEINPGAGRPHHTSSAPKAVGLSGQDGRFIHARRLRLPPEEPGGGARCRFVGEVSRASIRRDPSADVARVHPGDHADRRRADWHRLSHQLRRLRGELARTLHAES
jgi:hypothetical protein